MNQMIKFPQKLRPLSLIVPMIIIFSTCTPPMPIPLSDWEQRRNGDYLEYPLVTDADKYEAIMNMFPEDYNNFTSRDTIEDWESFYRNHCRTKFDLYGYGGITAGKAHYVKRRDPDYSPFKIEHDFLLFGITFWGTTRRVKCLELVWGGKRESTSDGFVANVVVCFSHFSINKGIGRRMVAIDLLPLQSPDTNEIYINFQGYDRLIRYVY